MVNSVSVAEASDRARAAMPANATQKQSSFTVRIQARPEGKVKSKAGHAAEIGRLAETLKF